MAEVARLGLEIDAKGVSETRAELLALARSAQETARQFASAGEVIEGAGGRIGNAPTGFEQFGTTLARTAPRMQETKKLIADVTGALGELGPVANVASTTMIQLATSVSPLGLLISGLAAATGLAVKGLVDLREEEEKRKGQDQEARYQQLKGANKIYQDLNAELEEQFRLMKSLDPELESIALKYEKLTARARQGSGTAAALADIERNRAAETARLLDGRAAAQAKIDEQNRAAVGQELLKFSAIGKTGAALAQANLAIQLYSGSIQAAAGANATFINSMQEIAIKSFQVSEAHRQISSGRAAAHAAEQTFGVSLQINKDQTAVDLAQRFVSVFKSLKNNPAMHDAVNEMFSSLVSQLSGRGTGNISGLLTSLGLSPRDIAELRHGLSSAASGFVERIEEVSVFSRNAFGGSDKIGTALESRLIPSLKSVREMLDESDRSAKNWDRTLSNNANTFGEIGARAGEVQAKLETIDLTIARERAIYIDPTPALNALDDITGKLAGIPDVTYKSVIMTTQFSASPARPFSEFLPFMAKTFGSLQDMVANSTPEVILNVPDIAQRLRQIADLERASAEAFHSANFPRGVGQVDSSGVRRQNQDAGLSLLQQSQDLALLLQADIARAQLAAERRGGGAAASGGDTFIFDAKGATFNSMTLDDALLQFERTIINATGVDPRIRVTS